MAGKKKERELTEAEDALLTDEEKKALEEEPDEKGEELEKGEGKEDEPGPKEEKKEEGKEVEPPEKEVKPEPPEGKGDQEKAKEGEDVEIPNEIVNALEELNIEIQSKSGKHFIPFSELEKARHKAKTYRAEADQLRADMGILKYRIEALEKPKIEEKAPEEKAPEINLDELETKIYDGDMTPKEALELVRKAGKPPETKPEETTTVDPNEIAAQVERKLRFEQGLEKIYGEYPMLKDNQELDKKAIRFGNVLIAEALEGKSEEEQMAWVTNPENLLGVAREAAKQVADSLAPKGSENFDAEAEREKIRKEEVERLTSDLVTKFNLKPDEVKTLSDVRASASPASKEEELDGKSAEELEDAMADMTTEERNRYLDGKHD